jgi:hypothetical protein
MSASLYLVSVASLQASGYLATRPMQVREQDLTLQTAGVAEDRRISIEYADTPVGRATSIACVRKRVWHAPQRLRPQAASSPKESRVVMLRGG